MSGGEVTLFLKFPGSGRALQRLQHSLLECVVEYKTGSDAELQTKLPTELFSQYQIKGTALLADDEILVEFTPKHSGVHSVRIFADTRELCKPVPFLVNQRGEAINIPPDRPFKKPPSAPEGFQSPSNLPAPTYYGVNNPRFPPSPPQSPVPQSIASEAQTEPYPGLEMPDKMPDHMRGFTSDPEFMMHGHGQEQRQSFAPQRASYLSNASGEARPRSMTARAGIYSGDTRSDETTFDDLFSSKKAGDRVYGFRRGPLTIDYRSAVTPDTLRMLSKEADIKMKVSRGGKTKKRCDICSKKVRTTKAVSLGEEDYCDHCFRRQFLYRSAIEHFMVPSIQECNIQVPINKKATKFVTARKTIANVNLRGLEPMEVRYAQFEFRKFDMENYGWIEKAVLLPMLKACLSQCGASDREAKALLSSDALKSMITSFGVDVREEVHEIEFLALFAFISRERERLRGSANPRSRGTFTRNDLEMAYAFRQQLGPQRRSHVPSGIPNTSPQRQTTYDPRANYQRESYYIPKSHTNAAISWRHSASLSPPKMVPQSVPATPQRPSAFGQSVQPGLLFNSPPPSADRRQTMAVDDGHVPLGERLARRTAVKRLSVVSGGGGGEATGDLPEEDQEEGELPVLPPDKDPSTHHTDPLIGKTPTKNKRLMAEVSKELKITGGKADGWMLY